MRRWLVRFRDRGPLSIGVSVGDALNDGSGSVHQLSSNDDARCDHTLIQRTDLQRAHIRATDLLRAGAHAPRAPLLQNR